MSKPWPPSLMSRTLTFLFPHESSSVEAAMKVVSYCALVVYVRRFAPPVLIPSHLRIHKGAGHDHYSTSD